MKKMHLGSIHVTSVTYLSGFWKILVVMLGIALILCYPVGYTINFWKVVAFKQPPNFPYINGMAIFFLAPFARIVRIVLIAFLLSLGLSYFM